MSTVFIAGRMQLIGQELIEYVKEAQANNRSKSDQCFGAGYVKEGGGLAWTDFYMALLEAKKEAGEVMHQDRVISASITSHMTARRSMWLALLATTRGHSTGAGSVLDTDLEELENAVQTVLKGSPTPGAEEWAVHDSQGLPTFLEGEYPSLSDLNDWAEQTANVDDRDAYMIRCENESRVLTNEEFLEVYGDTTASRNTSLRNTTKSRDCSTTFRLSFSTRSIGSGYGTTNLIVLAGLLTMPTAVTTSSPTEHDTEQNLSLLRVQQPRAN